MKNLLISAFLVIASIIFSGCTREVPVELPIFDKVKCEGANRVKVTNLVVIGKNMLSPTNGVKLSDLQNNDKMAWLIVPKDISDDLYLDIVFLYTKRNALNLTDCLRWETNRGDKYESYNIKSNELRK